MTETLTPEQRTAKVAKITALLQKTVENGCTPEEETSAKALADRLCDTYEISASECRPQERRRPRAGDASWTDTGNFWDDFFANVAKQAAREAEERAKADRARYQYRRNGVHVDEGYHADCMCSECRMVRANEEQKKKESYWKSGDPDPTYTYGWEPSSAGGPTKKTRKNSSHAGCSHEATSAARAKCRRQGGPL